MTPEKLREIGRRQAMAEMTAAEALGVLGGSEKQPQSEQELITSIIAGMTRGEKCFVLLWDSERVQIAALIEQQAQEIAKKDKMLKIAVQQLFDDGICPAGGYECNDGPVGHSGCIKCWLAWLEKEAQGELASDK